MERPAVFPSFSFLHPFTVNFPLKVRPMVYSLLCFFLARILAVKLLVDIFFFSSSAPHREERGPTLSVRPGPQLPAGPRFPVYHPSFEVLADGHWRLFSKGFPPRSVIPSSTHIRLSPRSGLSPFARLAVGVSRWSGFRQLTLLKRSGLNALMLPPLSGGNNS